MLNEFPTEIVLEILTYLPLPCLYSLQLTSTHWNNFILENESWIYHRVALLHRFVPSLSTELSTVTSGYADWYLSEVNDWKTFCKRRLLTEKRWMGKSPALVKTFISPGADVHRIKVDEKAGFAITTSAQGGLVVTDLVADRILWSLPVEYVRPYAHCEYSNGFLVFDRFGGFKEVWRCASDFTPADLPNSFRPDGVQERVANASWRTHWSRTCRGHFRPWALLRMAAVTHAFRFVYPTLLVASLEEAFLWNIPSATLAQTIDLTPQADASLYYVELSERHVFVVGPRSLRIFARDRGVLVLNLTSEAILSAGLSLQVHQPTLHRASNAGAEPQIFSHPTDPQPILGDHLGFCSVHVSNDGRDLAVLLDPETVVIIHGFERVIKGEATLTSTSLRVSISAPHPQSVYLAFEFGKVALALGSGIYVVTLANHGIMPHPNTLLPEERIELQRSPFPDISISRAVGFDDYDTLLEIGCLQMTETALFFTWNPSRTSSSYHELEASSSQLDGLQEDLDDNDVDDEDEDDDYDDYDDGMHVVTLPVSDLARSRLTCISFGRSP
ncbi:hypothetical protein JAAARDRAFT_446095 [Jaapia argillacea MUCL 33604]|uniref:F-box domain-containing protein n=1 Tax=Jaapia argillacea MUCL 33604 TaxID=933084 RepID=A0A067PDB6_9AGAM|nr:hypothetical protein JAAARDRAFT_446095 [Jaapia argillacea MUCL 33604]